MKIPKKLSLPINLNLETKLSTEHSLYKEDLYLLVDLIIRRRVKEEISQAKMKKEGRKIALWRKVKWRKSYVGIHTKFLKRGKTKNVERRKQQRKTKKRASSGGTIC